MKKLGLLFLIFNGAVCGSFEQAWQELKVKVGYSREQRIKELKEKFYRSQKGLMDREEYMEFIDSYMEKAQKELKVVEYCSNRHGALCDDYFNSLIEYTASAFRDYAIPEVFQYRHITQVKAGLERRIGAIESASWLTKVNTQEEMEKTEKLIMQANEEYYKKLSPSKKAHLYGVRAQWTGIKAVAGVVYFLFCW